jgi:hypothetical protein
MLVKLFFRFGLIADEMKIKMKIEGRDRKL